MTGFFSSVFSCEILNFCWTFSSGIVPCGKYSVPNFAQRSAIASALSWAIRNGKIGWVDWNSTLETLRTELRAIAGLAFGLSLNSSRSTT